MKLSILIPLYNKEKYVDRCLKSLLSQDITSNEYEIIVVDDGSKDSGASIVETYTKKHANIQLIRQQNQGPSAARNRCLTAAKGDYLYFLDADDYLAENVLHSLLEIGSKNNLEILEFNTKHTSNDATPVTQSQNLENEKVKVMDGMSYIAEHDFRNEAWRYFVKKRLLTDTGTKFIEGTLYEDAIFTASLFLKASRMAKINMDVHRYVVVDNSIVTSKDRAHNLKFIHGMVYAIEHFHKLIKELNSSNENYNNVVKKLRGRQQAFVFAMIIRTLKYRPFNFKELTKMLDKLKTFGAYPINPKIGGIGEGMTGRLYNLVFIPIFNKKKMLFMGMGVMRLIASR